MSINLQKGQRIEIGLSKVGVGLGWDPNESTGFDVDLDASAFMLGSNKKLPQDEFFVFYNNPLSPDKAVESSGDDTTGGNSDGGDDETLNVDWDGNELLLSDILGTEDDVCYKDLENEVEMKALKRAIGNLSERERIIVDLRYGLSDKDGEEKTQKEVADMLGISQSYISRLEKKIIKRLKREMVRSC